MTLGEWEKSLTAIELWMLRIYSLSIAFNNGGVLKKDRRKAKDLLNWSLTRIAYDPDRARELYVQWLHRLESAEDEPSV